MADAMEVEAATPAPSAHMAQAQAMMAAHAAAAAAAAAAYALDDDEGTPCPICLSRVGTDGGARPASRRHIADLQCGHRLCLACLKETRSSRRRECPECRAKCLAAAVRHVDAPVSLSERAARRTVLLRADRFARFETLEYIADEHSEDEAPPPSHQIADTNPWRDMSGDARTTRQHLRDGGGRPQCSLSAVRNLYRDQAYSAEELSEHVAGGGGDIRFPDWAQLLKPLCGAREVYRQFRAERVPSELLGDVRLAARSRVNLRCTCWPG